MPPDLRIVPALVDVAGAANPAPDNVAVAAKVDDAPGAIIEEGRAARPRIHADGQPGLAVDSERAHVDQGAAVADVLVVRLVRDGDLAFVDERAVKRPSLPLEHPRREVEGGVRAGEVPVGPDHLAAAGAGVIAAQAHFTAERDLGGGGDDESPAGARHCRNHADHERSGLYVDRAAVVLENARRAANDRRRSR